jgi:cytochrome b
MSAKGSIDASGRAASLVIWDPVLRVSHWLLVAAFAVAHLSAEEESSGPEALHVWSSYLIAAVVLLRVV